MGALEQVEKFRLKQLTQFGIVGALATAVQYLLLVLLVHQTGMSPPTASAVGFVLSSAANYLLNYHFTFQSQQRHGPTASKFLALAVTGLTINWVLMHMFVAEGWHYLIAQVCATAVVFLWNFVGNSLWTFRGYTVP